MKTQKGFTLIELIVVLTIVGFLATSAVGMIGTYITNAKLRANADDLRIGLQTAKTEAIKRNSQISIKPDTSGGWAGGWNIWIPASYTPTGAADLPLQARSVPVSNISVAVTDKNGNAVSAVYFTGSGRPSTTITNPPTYPITFALTPNGQSCPTATTTSEYTCLNVVVDSGGQVTTCKPSSTGIYGC